MPVRATMKKNVNTRQFFRFQWKTRYLKRFSMVFHFWCNFEKVAPALADNSSLEKISKKSIHMSVRADLPITKKKISVFFWKKIFLTVFQLFFIFDVILKKLRLLSLILPAPKKFQKSRSTCPSESIYRSQKKNFSFFLKKNIFWLFFTCFSLLM